MSIQLSIAALLLASLPCAVYSQENSTVLSQFCSSRPSGLYCSPESYFQKVECPSQEVFTCPQGADEVCQERGVLNTNGFKGGVARCVPFVSEAALTSFCRGRRFGTYCFGDSLNNVYVQCPNKLIYKCDDQPTVDSKVCNQTYGNAVTCELNGGGGGAGNPFCPPTFITILSTVTSVSTASRPAATSIATSAVTSTRTRTSTITETSCQFTTVVTSTTQSLVISTVTPPPQVSSSTEIGTTTDVDLTTRTVITVVPTTSVRRSTNVEVTTIYFPTTVFTSTVEFSYTTTQSPGAVGTVVTSVTLIPETTVQTVTTAMTKTTICDEDTVTATTVVTDGGAVDQGTFTILPQPDATQAPVLSTVTSTTTQAASSSSATTSSLRPTPSPVSCPDEPSLQQQIQTPDDKDFVYILTSDAQTQEAGKQACEVLGGQLASVSSTEDHQFLSQQICNPVWYKSWDGNDYNVPQACIALYPGGATAVPTLGCEEQLQALCSVPIA